MSVGAIAGSRPIPWLQQPAGRLAAAWLCLSSPILH